MVIDGVMYVSSAWSKVFALDAATGRRRWSFDPKVPGAAGYNACCDVVNRGVAVSQGRVFVGTIDGRLIALDARTGSVLWTVLTVDPQKAYSITGAPRVFKDKVIIGNGGSEYDVRGYVTAYDAATGKQRWRFFTVPGNPAGPPDGVAPTRSSRRRLGLPGSDIGTTTAAAGRSGMRSSMTKSTTASTLESATVRRGIERFDPTVRETICSSPRSWRWMPTAALIGGTTRCRRATAGTSTHSTHDIDVDQIDGAPHPVLMQAPRTDSST